MPYEYVKANPIRLRDADKDEKWLQEVISEAPPYWDWGMCQSFKGNVPNRREAG